ncbi:ABC transporter ATP-binding protein [Halalkalibacillus sediminis]|uniref:ABC transporter ATP-binding protein n=1 Tax=Halalkalibacillus sediminis TaxID=2018042 RepID=A0A2I0QRI9_9BACI|nr:ABC transporter ATP-binding protein [Halalkalibacillus sediminis]PKR76948.1 ABC transporter ATP-binding protein [Halalkalibacillus sediminis]
MSLVSVNHLIKAYKDKKAVDDISFSLNQGKCVALLGPNGAGKTTTLRMLAGFIKPTDGSITFNEDSLPSDFRKYVGYLPQFPVFHNWMTGKEFLVYVGELSHLSKGDAQKRADELLTLVHLSDAKDQRIGKYSGGMKQRLGIAQALIHSPKLIMLDEPVSSLDPIGRREVLNLMRELKKDATILFSTHILNDAEEVSEEILMLNHGKIVKHGAIEDIDAVQDTVTILLSFSDEPKFIEERLKEVETIFQVTREDHHFELSVHDLDLARKQIIEMVHKENWKLNKFEVARSTLEDVFMKAVQE